jgi:glycine/D-amino acid oxidase-like deaminating enzyme
VTVDLCFQRWRSSDRASPHRSIWLDEALAREPDRVATPLAGGRKADVCIIGGGFTGLWTAIRLREAEPSLRVCVVEADLCGAGASGRNSGAMGHWWTKLPTLVKLLGPDDAQTVLRASVAILDEMHDFVREHAIDCQIRRVSSVWSATAPVQVGAWNGVLRMAEKLGLEAPYRVLSDEEMRSMFGRGPYFAGVIEEGVTRLQPALLARGLRRAALALGVEIFEQSPVTRVEGGSNGLRVKTDRGVVEAQKLVLAANAWMAHLAAFRSYVMVVSSDIVVTDPIPDILERKGLRQRPGGVNSRLMLNYSGITPEGRVYLGRGGGTIAFGGRIGPAFDYSAAQAAEVEDDFRFLFPELKEVPIARAWAGPIDRAPTGLPWFGRLPEDPRIHYAIGYSGHGVAASAMAGRALAAAVLGRKDAWTAVGDCLLRANVGWYPPEPVRYLVGHVVRAAVARKERTERDGGQASRLTKSLAPLAPATITDFRRRAT